tara:strand:- start:683 stop:835 length:153 start_codon:yes stop_codon:yes gene_type:complete
MSATTILIQIARNAIEALIDQADSDRTIIKNKLTIVKQRLDGYGVALIDL